MRRFVRTFFAKRRAQVTVVQDSAVREFEVHVWRADTGLVRVARYPYAPGGTAAHYVKDVAVAEARRLVAVEAAVPGVQ